MTKPTSSKLALDTIVPVGEAPQEQAPALPTKRPYAVSITGPIDQALAKAAVLVRLHGYTFCNRTAAQVFGMTGMVTLTLVQGPVDDAFVPAAEAEMADAAAAERASYERDVVAEAARQLKARVDAEIASRKAALLAEQKRQLAALEADILANSK